MNLIPKILSASHILLDLEVGSKKRVFEQAGLLFENSHGIARKQVFDSLLARERLGSTGLGQGIALPHGRIKGLKNALGAFIRLQTPIQFEAPDGQPVQFLFVLLVPENASDLHLQLLSELAQLFSDRRLRKQLSEADCNQAMYDLFLGWQPHAAY